MSASAHKKQKTAVGAAAGSTAAVAARPPSLSDSFLRAALRPGQFCVMASRESADGDTVYTLFRFLSVASDGAQVVEYEPDPGQPQPPAVHRSWSEQLCLPVRPSALVSGSTVYALWNAADGAAPTTVYYRAVVQPLAKGKNKGKERQVQFGDELQTPPHTVQWEDLPLPGIMTPVALTAQLVQPLLASATASSSSSPAPAPSSSSAASSSSSSSSAAPSHSYSSDRPAPSAPPPRAIPPSPRSLVTASSGSAAVARLSSLGGSAGLSAAAAAAPPSSPSSLKRARSPLGPAANSLSSPPDIVIPLLSPSASLLVSAALSPLSSTASTAAQQRRKRTFYIHTPHATHSLHTDEPALQPIDERDTAGSQQQQQQPGVDEQEWRLTRYVSLLGCVHEWSEIRLLQSKQLVVAPYVLLSV